MKRLLPLLLLSACDSTPLNVGPDGGAASGGTAGTTGSSPITVSRPRTNVFTITSSGGSAGTAGQSGNGGAAGSSGSGGNPGGTSGSSGTAGSSGTSGTTGAVTQCVPTPPSGNP